VTTNEPRVSREHILALAKKCGMVWGYTTTELVDAVIGFAYVVLNDKAVQEAFVLANPRPVLDTLTQEISAMKQHLVEARQAIDINDFAHCAGSVLPHGSGHCSIAWRTRWIGDAGCYLGT